MASAALHIKDSYYFEVPKFLWRADYEGLKGPEAFPDFLVRLDEDYLVWQAGTIHAHADALGLSLPSLEQTEAEYRHWMHENHSNAGKPFEAYLADQGVISEEKQADRGFLRKWAEHAGTVAEYREHTDWSPEKEAGYNRAMSGKILIPQPFGELKNLYEPASGFCVSKFMIILVAVALIVGWLFIRLANRLRSSDVARGRLANAQEAILLYFRDEVARKAIGSKEGDKYVPLLWTIFTFILGCNLMGMIPWVGAPTGSFSVTLALAAVTLGTGILMGSKKFGVAGFWANQVPSMDVPIYMAVILKPILWAIEVLGLFIKHLVLAVRLLANIVAGHIVLLGIMMLAFSLEGAMSPSCRSRHRSR